MAATFRYNTLRNDQIRVLDVQPRRHGDVLRCSLRTVALSGSKNKYVALSWTWGYVPLPESSPKITLDGSQFPIPPNLHEALMALRLENDNLCIWIDAICIDQSSSDEKDQQIPLMAKIYTLASAIYVWLGEAGDNSDLVMEVLANQDEDQYKTSEFGKALFKLLQRPWWTRTWIVQEVALNENPPLIFCGTGGRGVSVELLLEVMNGFVGNWRNELVAEMFSGRMDAATLDGRYQLKQLRQIRDSSPQDYPVKDFRNALTLLRGFEVSQPQDKVYGMLGLVKAATRNQFLANFPVNTAKAVDEVYHDATRFLLQFEGSSSCFADYPLIDRRLSKTCPSWVLSFGVNFARDKLSHVRLVDVKAGHLDTPREPIQISDDHLRLTFRGVIIDKIDQVIEVEPRPLMTLTGNDQFYATLQTLRLLNDIRQLLDRQPQTASRAYPEPLWTTLIAGNYGGIQADKLLEDPSACQKQFDTWMALPIHRFERYVGTIWSLMGVNPSLLQKIALTLTPGRCFFTGYKGFYGIGPEGGVKQGDVLALLFPHHCVPFILRPKGENEVFEMVGVAYIPTSKLDALRDEIRDDEGKLTKFVIV